MATIGLGMATIMIGMAKIRLGMATVRVTMLELGLRCTVKVISNRVTIAVRVTFGIRVSIVPGYRGSLTLTLIRVSVVMGGRGTGSIPDRAK